MNLLVVRGNATADEVAAVVAVVTRRAPQEYPTDGYTRWRRARIASTRSPRAELSGRAS